MVVLALVIAFSIASTYSMGQTQDRFGEVAWIDKQLGLEDVSTFQHDIDLRIYLDPSITNSGSIIRLVKSSDGWTGEKYDYFLDVKSPSDSAKQISRITTTALESHRWDSLWARLENLGIATLPSQDAIREKLRKEVSTVRGKGYQVISVTDGSSYVVQVAKRGPP